MDELIRQGTVEPFIIVLPNELRSNLEAIQSLFGDAVLEDVIPTWMNILILAMKESAVPLAGFPEGAIGPSTWDSNIQSYSRLLAPIVRLFFMVKRSTSPALLKI
jgi:hypothetical protein